MSRHVEACRGMSRHVEACRGMSRQRPATTARYASFISRVPTEPGEFSAVDGCPLALLASSPTFDVAWPKPVFGLWPEGYAAKARVVWLGLPACDRAPGRGGDTAGRHATP